MKKLLLMTLFVSSLWAKQVVTIHGFMSSGWRMKKMVKLLEEKGNEVENWEYYSRRKYITEHASDLVDKLIEISKKHPNEPIDFVAHSMGSLVLRSALNHPNCPMEAKKGKAVLMGPPNQGSKFARSFKNSYFWRRRAGYKAGSELIDAENFDRLGEFPPAMKVLVIAGTKGINPFMKEESDSVVRAEETHLNTPHEYHEVDALHNSIMTHPTAQNIVINFLN